MQCPSRAHGSQEPCSSITPHTHSPRTRLRGGLPSLLLRSVPLLFTEDMYTLLSEGGKKYCRKLDVVVIRESQGLPEGENAATADSVFLTERPLPVYTYDIWVTHESRRLDLLR